MEPFAVPVSHIAMAFIAAVAIATIAWRRKLLDPGGSVAAALLGPAIVATGGWWLGIVLVTFFASAALLPEPDGKAPSRTWRQVLANGAPALGFAALSLGFAREPLLTGAAATIAAAAADTWATETGRAWGGIPWSIRTGRRVPPGTSGAVSVVGSLASVAGASVIALVALAAAPLSPVGGFPALAAALVIATSGSLGSATDTVLGAFAQARFTCTVCGINSEDASDHEVGHPMRHASGSGWLTNSGVNLIATVTGGLAATMTGALLY